MDRVLLKPIGVVRSSFKEEPKADHHKIVSEIVLNPELSGALDGLEDFSHIYVIYWAHKAREKGVQELKVHPQGRADFKPVGVYATRSPSRPNRICLDLVELLERKGNTIRVKGLDAYNGSPVLDIKPYDRYDIIPEPRVPEWWLRLHQTPVKK